MRKIYVVGGANGYSNWMQGIIVNKIEDANLVVLIGGADMSPELYNEPKGQFTYCDDQDDIRDLAAFKKAQELNIPMVGVCRGNQALCIFSGGRLVQHQENPNFIHKMKTYDDKVILVSSTHHQAAYPYNMNPNDYKILGWTNGISKVHLNGLNEEISDKQFNEVEVIYYPKTNCLGIQPHIEMLFGDVQYDTTIKYFQNILDKFLNKEL